MANPPDPDKLKKSIRELNEQLQQVGEGYGNIENKLSLINNESDKLNELYVELSMILKDVINPLNTIYRTHQDLSAELNKQNLLLKISKDLFNGITNISQKLYYQQENLGKLTDKELKSIKDKIKISEDDLKFLKERFKVKGDLNNINDIINKKLLEKSNLETKIAKEQEKGKKANIELIKVYDKKLSNIKDELIVLDQISEIQNKTIPTLKKELELSKVISKIQTDSLGIIGNTSKILEGLAGPLAKYLNLNEAIEKSQDLINDKIKQALDSEEVRNAIIKERKKQLTLESYILKQEEENVKNQKEKLNLQEKLNTYKKIDLNTGHGINKEIAEELNLRGKNGQLLTGTAAIAKYSNVIAQKQIDLQEEINNKEEEINKRKKAIKTNQDKINESQQKEIEIRANAVKGVDNLITRFQVFGKVVTGSIQGLAKSLLDPVNIFNVIISQAGKIDKELVQFQKSLSLTRTEAIGVRKEMALAAAASESNLINTHDLVKAQGNFNSLLGLQGEINEKNLTTQAELTKLLGVSAEAAAKLQFFSEATGQDFEQQKLAAYEATSAISAQYGVQVDQRQVMEEVGKQGAFALVQFKGSTAALAEAVAKAKALGISLEDVRQVASGLLDFESSISAELEAELLTGKQINLERARLLALTNDQSGLMDELANQQITLNEFQNMNLLQQQSLAKSLGMSTDKLSDMLLMEEYRNMNYKDIVATAGEDIAKRVETLTAQEKLNEAMIKFQSIIGDIVAGPLGQMMNLIGTILGSTIGMSAVLGALVAGPLLKFLTELRKIKMLSITTAIANIFSGNAKLGPLGIAAAGAGIAALIAAIATVNAKTQQVQDGIAPSSKGPFTITDRFGATAITTAGDSIAVSPNINRTSGGDNSEMVSLMKELVASNKNIEKKDSNLYMDSKAFGSNNVLGKATALGPSPSVFA